MIGKIAAALLLAATPALSADTNITLPDYAAYDPKADLAPVIPLCAAAFDAAAAGDTMFLERLFEQSKLPEPARNRVREICITFQLGALYLLREMQREQQQGGADAIPTEVNKA
jgi:hypothetical protein